MEPARVPAAAWSAPCRAGSARACWALAAWARPAACVCGCDGAFFACACDLTAALRNAEARVEAEPKAHLPLQLISQP